MPGHGGSRAPDGRQPQAKGVGAKAKRHDLEQPKTPGLAGSDLQSGDVGKFEQGQKAVPIRTKASAQQTSTSQSPRGGTSSQMAVPDAIEMAAGRIGGEVPGTDGSSQFEVDPRPWYPLLQRLATTPNSGGRIGAGLVDFISGMRRAAPVPSSTLVDQNLMDQALLGE